MNGRVKRSPAMIEVEAEFSEQMDTAPLAPVESGFPFALPETVEALHQDAPVSDNGTTMAVASAVASAKALAAQEEVDRLTENSRTRAWELGNLEAQIQTLQDQIQVTLNRIEALKIDKHNHYYRLHESDRQLVAARERNEKAKQVEAEIAKAARLQEGSKPINGV